MRSAIEIAKECCLAFDACECASAENCISYEADEMVKIIASAQREAIEAAAKALGHLLHRAPDGVYATAVNDCHTAILALLPAPAREGEANG